jgi:hypothetical protein
MILFGQGGHCQTSNVVVNRNDAISGAGGAKEFLTSEKYDQASLRREHDKLHKATGVDARHLYEDRAFGA